MDKVKFASKIFCEMKLIDISEQDRNRIEDIFHEGDIWILNREWKENNEGIGYFVAQLENDTDDAFIDHSEEFSKIFKELNCICVGFGYQNEYGEKDDTNTAYAIWFEKIIIPTTEMSQ